MGINKAESCINTSCTDGWPQVYIYKLEEPDILYTYLLLKQLLWKLISRARELGDCDPNISFAERNKNVGEEQAAGCSMHVNELGNDGATCKY